MPLYLTFTFAFLGFSCISAARVILTLFALDLGAQPFAIGVLVAMFYAFPLLFSWPIGALSDRVKPQWPLLAGAVAGAIGMTIPYFVHTMTALFLAAALSGLALAILHVLAQNLVGLMSKPAERARNFSNFSMIGASTNFVGPLIAGLAIDYTDRAIACLFVVAIWLMSAALILARGKVLPASKRHAGPPANILHTLADRKIWRTLATSSLAQLGTDLFQFYLPIHGHASGLSATAIGVVLAAFAVASFAVRSVLTRLVARFGEERLLAYSFYLGAAGFVLVPFCHSVLPLALVSFIFGCGMGCGQPITLMLMFSQSPQGRTGETLGLRLTVNNAMRVLGPAVFGLVGSAFGLIAVFLINGAVMAAGGVMALPPKKSAVTIRDVEERRVYCLILRGGDMFMRVGIVGMGCVLGALSAAAAHGQAYPQRPIRLILPVPPGGVADVIARPLAQKLTQSLGQSVVLDNRPGATGAIGLQLVAKAAPDGYTLLWGSTNTLCMGTVLYAKTPPIDDYAAITPVIIFHNVLVVNPAVPAKSVAELIEFAKARPEELKFASSGDGSTNHLTAVLFQSLTKTKVTHVPYKGGGPALIDVLGGHVQAMFATVPSAVTYIKDGRLKALAVTSEKREAALPSVPAAAEAGLPGLIVSTWNGVLAPASTPRAIVARLNAEIAKVVHTPEMVDRYAAQAAEVYTTTPERFAAIVRDDFNKWSKVAKEIGLKAN